MLKKIFIGLLVMSILSSGLLIFLLRQKSKEKSHSADHPVASHEAVKAESSSSPEGHATSEGHASTPSAHAENEEEDSSQAEPAEKETHASAETHEPVAEEKSTAENLHEEKSKTKGQAKTSVFEEKKSLAEEESSSEGEQQSLRLLTDPLGASVFVEGEFIGNTPVDISLKDQPIKVSIEAPGYKRFERQLPAKSGNIEQGKNLMAAVMKIHLDPEKKKNSRHTSPASTEVEPHATHASSGHSETPPETSIENPFGESHALSKPKVHKRKPSTPEKDFFIQVKSLPDQGAVTQMEVQRMSQVVRTQSYFAIHSCPVDLGAKGRWVRVLLGPYASAKEAEAMIPEAQKLSLDTESPFVTGEQRCQ